MKIAPTVTRKRTRPSFMLPSFPRAAALTPGSSARRDPLAGGNGEARGGGSPVDDAPPRVEIVLPPVLVLEVVGMFPDVDAEDRRIAVHQWRILVRRRDDRE